jgi:lysophospholipase L1-like esterase
MELQQPMNPDAQKMNERSLSRRLPALAASSLCLALALSGCGSSHSYATSAGGSTDFSSVVFIGDSLTAGYQNGSLLDSQQPHGYAALIAAQANFQFSQPLIAAPGAPAVLELKSVSPLDIVSAPGTTTGRDDITVTPTDVAVPGAFVNDVLSTFATPTPTTGQQEINTLVLGFPGLLKGVAYSQYSLALTENPTTIFAWIGNNDALVADIASTPLALTPIGTPGSACPAPPIPTDFYCQYVNTIGALAQTKAHLFLGNIPDVTLVPYLVPGAEVLGEVEEEGGLSEAQAEGITGLLPTDYINLTTFAAIPNIVACAEAGAPCPLDNPGTYGPTDPGNCPTGDTSIEPGVTFCILHATDIVTIQQTVAAYNQIIDAVAAELGATVVDINSVFANGYATGITANGCTGTYGFLGGLFGLDGIHPTNTGYGVLANAFITAINGAEGSSIAQVDLDAIAKVDPLWPTQLLGACPTTTVKGAKLGRSGGRLPTYAQARLIGQRVYNSLPEHAKQRIASLRPVVRR